MNAAAPPDAGIRLTALRELWLHTGTACNLSCPFCHEGSAPADGRIGALSFDQARRAIDEALAVGVERFAFTGGEPLILRGILEILAHAQQHRPCLVLTNGTAPLLRRAQHLARLRAGAHPVAFRVSIDHPEEDRHDAGRGLKTFRKALEGLKLLHVAGFETGITRLRTPGENAPAVQARFRSLLRRQGLPEHLDIRSLEELGKPGAPLPTETSHYASAGGVTPVTECSRGRMAIAGATGPRYLPCPLVDDEPDRVLGANLAESMAIAVQTTHRRCKICRTVGVDYVGIE